MTISNSEISLYVDSLIVEALLVDDVLIKNGQGSVIHQLIDKVKDYFGSHVDPNNKTESFLNIIAPGVVALTLRALGLGWISWLFGLAMEVFHINVGGILNNIYGKIKSLLSNGETTSAKVDAAVQDAVAFENKPVTEQEATEAEIKLKQQSSVAMQLREAQFVKMALIDFYQHKTSLKKEAGFFDAYSGKKSKIANTLVKVLSWFFKVALASAGLLVAGDIVNKFLGRPNALDKTIQDGKVIEPKEVSAPVIRSTQTKFPLQIGYIEENYNTGSDYWDVNIPANETSINNMLLQFSKDVYKGLDNSLIQSSPEYQALLDKLLYVNRNNIGTNVVIIPKMFHSKKQIVDTFIDDVAKKL